MRGNYTFFVMVERIMDKQFQMVHTQKRFYIPLRFWFNNNEGMYLPTYHFLNVESNYSLILPIVGVIGESNGITSLSITPTLYENLFS